MKFIVLSGAYINAGDFLIVDRTIRLLKEVFPDSIIKKYKRNEDLNPYLDEINESDALIIAGGPAYSVDLYPNIIPLIEDLSKIKTKIIPIGPGWYGRNISNEYLYDIYKFTEETKVLLKKIQENITKLSARDWYTVRSLKANGFDNAIMTGCPAWYDIPNVDKTKLRDNINLPFKKICISDPAKLPHINQSYRVAKYLREKYPEAEINFIFHRIDKNKKEKERKNLISALKEIGVKVHDISYGVDGFKIYDDCDLHLGYRVHAHIYNLGKRNISVLLEEDGRGAGANSALKLNNIIAYNEKSRMKENKLIKHKHINKVKVKINKILKRIGLYNVENLTNKYILKNIDDYLEELNNANYNQFNTTFNLMKYNYDIMIKYIKNTIEGENNA